MRSAGGTEALGLMAWTTSGGCGCKMRPRDLTIVTGCAEDSGSWGLWSDVASVADTANSRLLVSVDFGTPVTPDPASWGDISALHALSDLFASGCEPTFALAVMGWPRAGLDFSLARQALRSASETLLVEGASLVGGHSIYSHEPFLGFAVGGRALGGCRTLEGAQPGDHIVVTKSLGIGLSVAGFRSGVLEYSEFMDAIGLMRTSNRTASEVAGKFGISCATDVSGFGLAGHARNLADASRVTLEIDSRTVPVLESGMKTIRAHGVVGNGTENVWIDVRSAVDWGSVDQDLQFVFCDPQTSGGLLLAVPEELVEAFLRCCSGSVSIGRVMEQGSSSVVFI